MLYFRSEEDIDRWCETWRQTRGAVIPIDVAWKLATAWYSEDRRDPKWRRRTPEEAGMRLARAPRPFSLHTSRHLMRLLGKSDDQWRKYLFY